MFHHNPRHPCQCGLASLSDLSHSIQQYITLNGLNVREATGHRLFNDAAACEIEIGGPLAPSAQLGVVCLLLMRHMGPMCRRGMSLEQVKKALPEVLPEPVQQGHMPTRAALLQAGRPDLAAAIRV